MNKTVAIILAVVTWVGVGVTMNFSKIVPHASPREVEPFVAPMWILAAVMTFFAYRVVTKSPPKP